MRMSYECDNCGYQVSKWMGNCSKCRSWNSFLEVEKIIKKSKKNLQIKKINEIFQDSFKRIDTGINEVNRVLGKGLTLGSLTLLGGEPGVGKSTLLMNIVDNLVVNSKRKVLYVSGEESEHQISLRAKRLKISSNSIYLLHTSSWDNIKEALINLKPDFFILDSIQTTRVDDLSSSTGSVSQIKEVTSEILNYCKPNDITGFIIGHVTKEGSIGGPKVLEHIVDTVLYLEGNNENDYKVLRSKKNRFGNTLEIGILEMTNKGFISSKIYNDLNKNDTCKKIGSAISSALEGGRTIIFEIEALVHENKLGNVKRVTQGFDIKRLSMLIAIIEKYFEIPLHFNDIYINIRSDIKINDNSIDLAVIASILSSYYKKAIDSKSIFIGEVSLNGDIKKSRKFEKMIIEIKEHYFKKIVTGNFSEKRGLANLSFVKLASVIELNQCFS